MSYLWRLAIDHLKRGKKDLLPYLISLIVMVVLSMTIELLILSPSIKTLQGASSIMMLLSLGKIVLIIFAFIFANYTHQFWFNSEQKEIGLFLILGMKKRDISKIITYASLVIFSITMVIGTILSLFLGKLMLMILVNLLKGSDFSLQISSKAIISTVIIYGLIFLCLLLKDIFSIHFKKIQTLLRQKEIGEKEPKARWILSLLGIACIAAAYYIAITINNPISALMLFFVAVILVIFGTYLLFIFGIVAYFKWRKKRPSYYQPKNFIQVSSMLFRMKQNAVGLASIAILMTMTLVTVMSSSALYFGMDQRIDDLFPKNAQISNFELDRPDAQDEALMSTLNHLAEKNQVKIEKPAMLKGVLQFTGVLRNDGTIEHLAKNSATNGVYAFSASTIANYNDLADKSIKLNSNEVLIYNYRNKNNLKTISINGKKFKVVQNLNEIKGFPKTSIQFVFPEMIIFFSDESLYPAITDGFYYFSGEKVNPSQQNQTIYADLKGKPNAIKNLVKAANESNISIETKDETQKGLNAFFGGFLFIGILLGISFILATSIIIYYKQVSAGLEDQKRFEIMQKVGLSKQEVWQAIRRQVSLVFFLPVSVAVIHFLVSLPIIIELLKLFGVQITGTLYWVIAITIMCIVILYFIVYQLTSKVYYQIVERK
ncbi:MULTISPECIES: ABC transporter permease [unclassified Enterococcus]|uniref:FtsX-like permease family protein n=1 Tax=unclassified Enterococcus TaxID=2608891 RepID=UPI0015562454|nr:MULTISPECIES: ABC transporter permease [unclassified Enterococcus]MBS7576730.1 FtsX-like permease family protein [Enterococcus sp. MMGLQ5-2]MBS7583783.1 FtsX-like permease family protein [Enterococcus sp. MMGLQ5-1]NPD11644.1 FtsX-like permease family protein [Enterococcus sp. MMGLQ5-1]NPD36567.1 FtsX-like permease family protein [Enterococcus sp. MMGLQ5-2]